MITSVIIKIHLEITKTTACIPSSLNVQYEPHISKILAAPVITPVLQFNRN